MEEESNRQRETDNVIDFTRLDRHRRRRRAQGRRKKWLAITVLALLAAGAVALVGYQIFLAAGGGGFWGNFAP